MSSSFENEKEIEFNGNMNLSASAFFRYDPVYLPIEVLERNEKLDKALPWSEQSM